MGRVGGEYGVWRGYVKASVLQHGVVASIRGAFISGMGRNPDGYSNDQQCLGGLGEY